MNPIQNKVITIASIEDKGVQVVITDHEGVKYSFWKNKQDGTETNAWKTFQTANHNGSHQIGTHTQLSYKEETKTNNYGKTVTYRTVIAFLGGVQAPAPAQKTVSVPLNGSQTPPRRESNDDFGRRLAIHGMVNGLLCAGLAPEDIDLRSLGELEDRIDRFLAGKLTGYEMAKAIMDEIPLPEPPPEVEPEPPIDVEEIPF